MPALKMSDEETREVVANEQIVRVSFHDGNGPYLIPLGYVSLGSALYGVAELGRKTMMAAKNPHVALQIDTSASTGIWEWSSVTGEAEFALVTDAAERQRALAALRPVIAEAPDWWQQEQGPRMASGELHVWRITPTFLNGRRFAQREPGTA